MSTVKRIKLQAQNSSDSASALVYVWVLRALVPLGGYRELFHHYGYTDDALAGYLGLSQTGEKFDSKKEQLALRKMHKDAETVMGNCPFPPQLVRNVERIGELLGLNETDKTVFGFATLLHVDPWLQKAMNFLGGHRGNRLVDVLTVVLNIEREKIRASIQPRSPLFESGLLQSENYLMEGFNSKLSLHSDRIAERLLHEELDPVNLIQDTVSLSSKAELGLEDFDHLADSLAVLKPYLKLSLEEDRIGVNIFIHGVPGTGKTQLTRSLAQALDSELFEVTSQDLDGESIDGAKRLRSFRAAQGILKRRKALILFDETEDIFRGDDDFGFVQSRGMASKHKAFMNRLLENNPVPTFWLSNSVQCMDAAFLRRFDIVIEMPLPRGRLREKMINETCGDLIDVKTRSTLVEAKGLAPAVIKRASQVIRAIRDELPPEETAPALETLIESTLIAQGHGPLIKKGADALPEDYDPGNIAADADLKAVSEGIISAGTGRLCLYGPPGTGKSAYGRWLAQQLDAPLHAKRISDLVSPYVGQTEKNLAQAFREADDEGAVLLLDEVDSFLRDRMLAKHSWEISAVNEMLVQMETFSGVFVASTNLMDGLDQAALRRFDLKVKFDYLQSDQAWVMFQSHCKSFGFQVPENSTRVELNQLKTLTPGDFAAVARQNRFRPVSDSAALIAALSAECAIKKDQGRKPMGFLVA